MKGIWVSNGKNYHNIEDLSDKHLENIIKALPRGVGYEDSVNYETVVDLVNEAKKRNLNIDILKTKDARRLYRDFVDAKNDINMDRYHNG